MKSKKKREIFVCTGCNLFKHGISYGEMLNRIDIFRCTLEGLNYSTKQEFVECQLPESCPRKLEHLVVTRRNQKQGAENETDPS